MAAVTEDGRTALTDAGTQVPGALTLPEPAAESPPSHGRRRVCGPARHCRGRSAGRLLFSAAPLDGYTCLHRQPMVRLSRQDVLRRPYPDPQQRPHSAAQEPNGHAEGGAGPQAPRGPQTAALPGGA